MEKKWLCDVSIDEIDDALLELEESFSITVQRNRILNIEINKEKWKTLLYILS